MNRETEWDSRYYRRPAGETVLADTSVELKAAEALVAAEWKIGDVILDLYEVKSLLGEGTFGKVYQVHHRNWNLDLAVKTPKPEIIKHAGGKESFINEAETWVNLGLHPHTVSCYYVRDLDGIPRMFVEYVEGGSLEDWIKSARLYEGGLEKALERILDIAIQFAWGLQHAHEHRLVHKDVKPDNVMMTPDSVVKVTDFGLARARAIEKSGAPAEGDTLLVHGGGGTAAFVSPEQAAGKPLSRQTDIWSWAVSLLEMFAGEVFWASGIGAAETLEHYLENEHDHGQVPRMPDMVVKLLRECFSFDPNSRPKDMLTVAHGLQQAYEEITNGPYSRELPKETKALADSLNNRAVSLMDLGRTTEALQVWNEALEVQPHHLQATYNRGLVLSRAGELGDDAFVKQMEEVRKSHEGNSISDYLRGLVYLELGDSAAAVMTLESTQDKKDPEIKAVLATARKRLRQTLVDKYVAPIAISKVAASETATEIERAFGKCMNSAKVSFANGDPLASAHHIRAARSISGCERRAEAIELWSDLYIYLPRIALNAAWVKRTIYDHSELSSVVLNGNGQLGLCGYSDNGLKLWDLSTGECLRSFEGHTAGVSSAALSADGRYALSGSYDDTLKLWNVATGQCLRTFEGHGDAVYSAALSADGRYALSGGCDESLKLWNVASGECLRSFDGHSDAVSSVNLSADGKCALSASWDDTLRYWDIATGQCLQIFEQSWSDDESVRSVSQGSVSSVSLSADGKYALCGSWNGVLYLWDVATGQRVRTFEGHTGTVVSLSLNADRKYAVSWSADYTVKLWDIANGHCLRTIDIPWSVAFVSISTDAKYVLSRSRDDTMRLQDVATGEYGPNLKLPGNVGPLCLSSNAKYVLSGNQDNTLKLWNAVNGECLQTFHGHIDRVIAVSFSGDAKHALSGGEDGMVKLWDVTTGKCRRTFEGHTEAVISVGLNWDATLAVSASSSKLKLWDVVSGECLRTHDVYISPASMINSACLSGNGRYALSGSEDATLRLWDVATGRCLRIFEGHARGVTSVIFSHDERYVLSGSEDKMLKLWDVATGKCVRTFEDHTEAVNSVTLSGDGKYALSGSRDNSLKVWILDWELDDRERNKRPDQETDVPNS